MKREKTVKKGVQDVVSEAKLIRDNCLVNIIGRDDFNFKIQKFDGQELNVQIEDLDFFGIHTSKQRCMDIISEKTMDNIEGTFIKGRLHLSKRVRESHGTSHFTDTFWKTCGYAIPTSCYYFNYETKSLNNSEVITILLDDVLYGLQPLLNSIFRRGNFYQGFYYCENENEYCIELKNKRVKIYEAFRDEYDDVKKSNLIYDDVLDNEKHKLAILYSKAISLIKFNEFWKSHFKIDLLPNVQTWSDEINSDSIIKKIMGF